MRKFTGWVFLYSLDCIHAEEGAPSPVVRLRSDMINMVLSEGRWPNNLPELLPGMRSCVHVRSAGGADVKPV